MGNCIITYLNRYELKIFIVERLMSYWWLNCWKLNGNLKNFLSSFLNDLINDAFYDNFHYLINSSGCQGGILFKNQMCHNKAIKYIE